MAQAMALHQIRKYRAVVIERTGRQLVGVNVAIKAIDHSTRRPRSCNDRIDVPRFAPQHPTDLNAAGILSAGWPQLMAPPTVCI